MVEVAVRDENRVDAARSASLSTRTLALEVRDTVSQDGVLSKPDPSRSIVHRRVPDVPDAHALERCRVG